MSVHTRIRRFRESKELTHQQFADAVGVSRGAVQQWESGATAPARRTQPAVAAFMGITVSELMANDTTLPATRADFIKSAITTGGMTFGSAYDENHALALAGRAGGATETIATPAAIEVIAAALAMMTDAQRETMAGKLASLARAPDSPTLKKSISESLASSTTPPPPPDD